MTKKKCHSKNDKYLNDEKLNDENHTQIVSPGKKKHSTACAKS